MLRKLFTVITSLMVLQIVSWAAPLPASGPTIKEMSKAIIAAGNASTPFPPSFLGHTWAYGMALFAQLTIFSFALTTIFFQLSVLDFKRDSIHLADLKTWKSPVNVYRVSIALYMIAVVCGVSGNLLVYMSWNEVQASTLNVYFTIDKVLKAVAIIPFLSASYLMVRHDEVITFHLITRNPAVPLWPSHETIRDQSKTIFWIFIMAIGLTYSKWGASVGP